jgi:hypothetical protein
VARGVLLALASVLFFGGTILGADTGKAETPARPKQAARTKKAPEPWDAAKAAEEYRRLEFELALARTGDVYMVIDADRRVIQLKMKGTVVWNTRMDVAPGDSGDVGAFARRFAGGEDRLIRMLTSKHLFAAKEKTPDSILAIVGQVVKADPQLLQRDIPERFELKWGWDVILDVRTDIAGEPRSRFKNFEIGLIEALQKPLGGTRLKVRLASDDALTLYRAAVPGLPTLVYWSQ